MIGVEYPLMTWRGFFQAILPLSESTAIMYASVSVSKTRITLPSA